VVATDPLPLRDRLRTLYPASSGRTLKGWLLAGRVRVNGTVVRRGDAAVRPDDHVELGDVPPPEFPTALRRIHEDDDVIVIDKPPGLLTIATEHERERTAYRLLMDYLAAVGGRIFVVHRLDRETSGLLVFARSPWAKQKLQEQFAERAVERVYVAVVEGRVSADAGTLSGHLVQDRHLRVRPTRDRRAGKEAITHYRVLRRGPRTTALELTLGTGRRGQIRAQLAGMGHPIVGDAAYGSRTNPLRRLCLHAARLGFTHPRGRRVVYESPAPAAFERLR
ncbi:MAG: RluA family pseudouridine synthase, partial [Candidatus Rokubacteria bacterium]|nr:RluA family pseudouridine synthase [Candidatus Rokubacteria bacterium]